MNAARRKGILVCTGLFIFACTAMVVGRAIAAPQGSGGSGYHLAKKIALGGEGFWDYLEVDAATHRVFISRGTHVMVVDPEEGKVVGDIPDTQGVHGIVLAPEFNRASPATAAVPR